MIPFGDDISADGLWLTKGLPAVTSPAVIGADGQITYQSAATMRSTLGLVQPPFVVAYRSGALIWGKVAELKTNSNYGSAACIFDHFTRGDGSAGALRVRHGRTYVSLKINTPMSGSITTGGLRFRNTWFDAQGSENTNYELEARIEQDDATEKRISIWVKVFMNSSGIWVAPVAMIGGSWFPSYGPTTTEPSGTLVTPEEGSFRAGSLQATGLAEGRVPSVSAGGLLADDAGLTRTQSGGVTNIVTIGNGATSGVRLVLDGAADTATGLAVRQNGVGMWYVGSATTTGDMVIEASGVDQPLVIQRALGGVITLGGAGGTKRDVKLTKLAGTGVRMGIVEANGTLGAVADAAAARTLIDAQKNVFKTVFSAAWANPSTTAGWVKLGTYTGDSQTRWTCILTGKSGWNDQNYPSQAILHGSTNYIVSDSGQIAAGCAWKELVGSSGTCSDVALVRQAGYSPYKFDLYVKNDNNYVGWLVEFTSTTDSWVTDIQWQRSDPGVGSNVFRPSIERILTGSFLASNNTFSGSNTFSGTTTFSSSDVLFSSFRKRNGTGGSGYGSAGMFVEEYSSTSAPYFGISFKYSGSASTLTIGSHGDPASLDKSKPYIEVSVPNETDPGTLHIHSTSASYVIPTITTSSVGENSVQLVNSSTPNTIYLPSPVSGKRIELIAVLYSASVKQVLPPYGCTILWRTPGNAVRSSNSAGSPNICILSDCDHVVFTAVSSTEWVASGVKT